MPIVYTKTSGRVEVSPGAKGALNEHVATAWLISNGYDVFRNVSPNGRADLLAVDWGKDETIRVDVKSQRFSLCTGKGKVAEASKKTADLNKGFDIKYLVVNDDWSCEWYKSEGDSSGDGEAKSQLTWWMDKGTGQRFPSPGNEMTRHEWSYFCKWCIENHSDIIAPFSEQFIRDMSVRGRPGYETPTARKEITVLEKFLRHVHDSLLASGEAVLLGGK